MTDYRRSPDVQPVTVAWGDFLTERQARGLNEAMLRAAGLELYRMLSRPGTVIVVSELRGIDFGSAHIAMGDAGK